MLRVKFWIFLSWSMTVNSMGFLHFSIFCEKNSLSRRPDTSAGYTKNRCFFTRWIQRNPSEKTILSCSLTPRPFFALVGTATLLKRQNAIIPKRIFQERDPFFLQMVWWSVKMPFVNSFSHLYSKSAFLLSQREIRIIFSPKCEKVGSIRHLPRTKVSDFGTQWTHVTEREFALTFVSFPIP